MGQWPLFGHGRDDGATGEQSGQDEDGHVRMAELPGHPFFLASLFQPELYEDGPRPHPMIRALARAAVDHAARAKAQPV